MNIDEMLRPNLVRIGVSVDTWEEAIKEAGSLLVTDGAVEPRFIDAMIDFAREFKAYIVVAKNFAMPHARPEDGVLKASMALITLKEPVYFGHPDNDPVSAVLALACENYDHHIEALSELAESLLREEVIPGIILATTEEEARSFLINKTQ